MIQLRISTWPEGTGLNHSATTWQISDNTDFSNILDESVADGKFIDVYYSTLAVPLGKEYYGRSKRHFGNGGEAEWVGPIKLLPAEAGEHIDVKPETVIEEPSIKIEEDGDDYILKAGSFRCDSDGHKATNWILRNGLGTILYRSMYNEVSKRAIRVSKNKLAVGMSNILSAEVSYISTNDFESPFGSCKLTLGKFIFEVVSNTNFIPIHEDYEFKFKALKRDDEYTLSRYVVRDNEGKVIQEGAFDVNAERIIIEREKLRAKTSYYIDFYQKDLPDDIKTVTFYTNRNSLIYRTDKRFKYMEDYVETVLTVNNPKQTTAEQLVDNGIPIAVNDDKIIRLFNFDRRFQNMTVSDLAMGFLNKTVLNDQGVNVKMLDSERILVDSQTNTNGGMEFKIYDYNYHQLLGSKTRTDEEVNHDVTNSLTTDGEQQVYYFAKVGEDIKFRKFNPNDLSIVDLTSRPDIEDLEANLVYIGKDRIMSFNGSKDKNLAYIYDIGTDSWMDVTIVPEKYRTLTMTSFLRKDGKVASFNTGNDTNDVLVFDPDHNSFESVVNTLDDTIDLDSTVRLRNGEFLRYNSKQVNSKVYIYR